MSRWIDIWLPGSGSAAPAGAHPGEKFGLPAEGISAAAGFGRRLAALTVDWLLGYAVAALFLGSAVSSAPFTVLGIWFLLTVVPVAVFGASAGMTAFGIRVASIGSEPVVGVPRAVLRTALIALVVPPLVRDADGRGWHDRASRTIVVHTRA